MTEPDLISAGYRKYSHSYSNADRFYQKTIRSGRDRSRKLYFINVSVWDFSKYERFPRDQDPIRFEAEAHLYARGGRSYRLVIPVEADDTIDDIEGEYSRAYAAMECVPDIHNNDGD